MTNLKNTIPAVAVGVIVAAIATFILQSYIEADRTNAQRQTLEAYIAERAAGRNALFEEAQIVQATAQDLFFRHYSKLDQSEVDTIFEDRFPVREDGTRRSHDEDFEGRRTSSGHLIYGFGAFLGKDEYSARERREIVAAYLATTSVGPGVSGLYESLYFNDSGDSLIIFAPDRDDRLEFYRHTAPADFEFSDMSFVQIVQPATNPSGQFACTSLTDLMYRQDERQLTIGCHLPVRQMGRQIGAFGMTLDVRDYLLDAVVDPSGREAFVVNREGNIVAHQALFQSDVITSEDVASVHAELELDRLAAAISGNGQRRAVISDPTSHGLAAFEKMAAPGWYLVIREPKNGSSLSSWLQAALFGLVGGVLAYLQTSLIPARRSRDKKDQRESSIKA